MDKIFPDLNPGYKNFVNRISDMMEERHYSMQEALYSDMMGFQVPDSLKGFIQYLRINRVPAHKDKFYLMVIEGNPQVYLYELKKAIDRTLKDMDD